ncbi:CHAT domain-containing protein [Streptomyces sp. yr375]|uniref:CHAT domain-containing protein n=1 Tax=Streptomyces sp. yr375 TaxID=1761906 RepID=UPI0008CE869E|nr:CHAT domain-containing protein [Streptomyces sp. yr375]SEP68413.1 CHAT domain-containing protein [Streptomyces sp. yr375]
MVGQNRPCEYRDFTVRLVRATPPTGHGSGEVWFDVHAVEAGVQETGKSLHLGHVRQFAAEFDRRCTTESPVARGMGRALLPGPVVDARFRIALEEARQRRAGVRLCIETTDPELAAIPWEISAVQVNTTGGGPEWQFLYRHETVSVARRRAPSFHPAEAEASEAKGPVVVATALDVVDRHGRFGLVTGEPGGAGHVSAVSALQAAGRLRGTQFEPVAHQDPVSRAELCATLATPAWAFVFGGHGTADGILVTGPGGREDLRLMTALDLADTLRGANVQVAVLAACHTATATATAATAAEGGAVVADTASGWSSVAGTLVDGGVPWVIGMRGLVDDKVAADLTREFLAGLQDGDSVENALARARAAVPKSGWLPVLHTSASVPDARFRPPAPPVAREELAAFPVVSPKRVAAGGLVYDRGPCRLDVLWGLDRGPIRGVLADRPGTRLADELHLVEYGPLSRVTRPPGRPAAVGQRTAAGTALLPRRQWYEVPHRDGGELPGSSDALNLLVSRPYGWSAHLKAYSDGSSMGFAVCWDAPPGCAPGAVRPAVDLMRAIASLLPGAAIVLHVRGDDEEALLAAAEEAAGSLPARDDGSVIAPAVLTRVRWGDTAWRPVIAPGPPGGGPTADAAGPPTIRDRVDRYKRKRAQPAVADPWLNTARRAVEELAADEETSPLLREPEFLAAELFRVGTQPEIAALLRVLALERDDDEERYASLAAAATRDDHLDVWLAAAEGLPPSSDELAGPAELAEPAGGVRPVDPLWLPPALFPEPVRTRVVLGLLRRGDDPARAVPRPVWDGQVPRELRRVLEYLRSAPKGRDTADGRAADREFLLGLDNHTYEAADMALRAGVGRYLTIRELAPAGEKFPRGRLSFAGWAALASRPLERSSVELLGDEPAEWMRRAVGLHEKPAEPDGDNLRFAEGLRRALFTPHPPLAPPLGPPV